MKNKSLLRQIQTKLAYLKKYETESPSSFQEIIVSNGKSYVSHSRSKINDLKILTSPLKNNIISLKSCYQYAVNRLWNEYYKRNVDLNENQDSYRSLINENHILSLRELASFALADTINKHNNNEENNEENEKDPFQVIPSYIPSYLNK